MSINKEKPISKRTQNVLSYIYRTVSKLDFYDTDYDSVVLQELLCLRLFWV